MRSFLLSLSIILILVSVGCGIAKTQGSQSQEEKPVSTLPAEKPGIVGIIKKMSDRSFLVESEPHEKVDIDKINTSWTDKTKIFIDDGKKQVEGTMADLKVGQKVAVWYDGPLAESYPAQGRAKKIVILEQ